MKHPGEILRLVALSVLFLVGCASLPELDQAQDAQARGDHREAHRYYRIVIEKDPGNEEALAALDRLQGILTDEARAAAMASAGDLATSTAPQLREALAVLDEAAPYDPGGERLDAEKARYANRLATLEQTCAQLRRTVGNDLGSLRFSAAREGIDRIRKIDPAFAQLDGLEMEYRSAYGGFLGREVMRELDGEDFPGARAALQRLRDLSGEGAKVAQLEQIIDQREIAWLDQALRSNMRERQYYTAYLNIQGYSRKEEFAELLEGIRSDGAAFYLAQGRRRAKEGDLGRAYLEAVKAYELDRNEPGIFEFHRDMRDAILERVQRYIAVPTFGAPRDDPDVGAQFSDALISYLFRIFPYGINIVEREKIDMLLAEHKRELSEVGKLFNVDLVVTGNVSLLNVERQDTRQNSTIQVQVGESKQINPAYELYYRTDPRPETPPPPQLITLPEYEKVTYVKGKAVLKGFGTVSVRIFDVKKGSITYAQEFNASFQASDDFQDAVEMAGIEVDPLELPTQIEVKEKLREKIIRPLAEVIQDQFGRRAHEYLGQAKYHLSRREDREAMDQLARGFLYCTKARVPSDDEAFSSLRSLVIERTERDFLPEPIEE